MSEAATSYAELWGRRMAAAWHVPPPMRPSAWAEKYRVVHHSAIPGPYRVDNAPYQRGLMDIPTRPGCVRAVCEKGARIGWSEVLRNLIGYWAHYEPCRLGLTLPNRDEGRKVCKSEVVPFFRKTEVLRELAGNLSRDVLTETIDLVNGFHLGLMWSGSSASTAGKLYRVVIVDEADKTEQWAGDEPDLIGRLESRISTYLDKRLMLLGSTPTTTAGVIHRELLECNFTLHFHVPCPSCGRYQRLVWPQFKWAKLPDVERWLEAARNAAAGGRLQYEDGGYVERFAGAEHLGLHIEFLEDARLRMQAADSKAHMADVIAWGREHLVWYQCEHCPGRIYDQQKAPIIRRGRWTTEAGYVTDYWGKRHEDAEAVERWPNETRIGFQIASWYGFLHWGTIVAEFLRAEGNLHKAFNWRTERAGEPFEFRVARLPSSIFAGKAERATLAAGIVPKWAQLLLCTIDTQMDHFYYVVRAWGAGEISQRVWHGKLTSFEQIDHLLYEQNWPTEGNLVPPRRIDQSLIDSGGSEDRLLDATRTQQVYTYVIPRQGLIRAIKGANKPGPGVYWAMKNPMGGQARREDWSALHAWLVDKHRCNDLLADLIIQGVPRKDGSRSPDELEKWLLNRCPEPAMQASWEEYDAHMAAVHKAPNKPGRNMIEIWKPVHSGARIDYRDCEAYQIALAQMCFVHLLPPTEEYLKSLVETPATEPGAVAYVERFRRR
jgi:phage terminase large subunit GpA-like protein